MKRIRSITLGLGFLVAAGTASAQANDTLAKVKATGTITIGSRDNSIPFSYRPMGDSDPIGFTNDICLKVVEAVKARLKLPQLQVRYVTLNSTNRIPLIQNGTADLDCATTTNTQARQQQVAFAPSHFVARITAAVKKGSGITSLADLKGRTVATVSGSTSIQLLRSYRRTENIDVQEVSGKDTVDGLLLLASDRAVAYVLDDVQLASLIATSKEPAQYTMLNEVLRQEPYGVMYRKDDPQFKELVDQTIAGLMKSGAIDELYAKWFMRPIPPNNVNLNFPMTDAVRDIYRKPNSDGV